MKRKLMLVVFGLGSIGCGGLDDGPPEIAPDGRPYSAAGRGGHGFGGSVYANGGADYGSAGTGYGLGGSVYANGGADYGSAGTSYGLGGSVYANGGADYGSAGTGYGLGGSVYANGGADYGVGGTGYGLGGFGYGGYSVGGSGREPDNGSCLEQVSHCLTVASDCFEYSPWSDCDQIIGLCDELQQSCAASRL
jgi:hypothetical protein